MYLASTIINYKDNDYEIDNLLLIEYLLKENMNISELILENPYFIFQLFDIFKPIKNSKIVNLDYCKGKVIIETLKEKLEIEENSSNGLTLVREGITNNEGNFLVKSKEIYEIFPDINGMILVEHEQVIVNNINVMSGELRNSLSISCIDYNGIKTKQENVVVSVLSDTELMNLILLIEPLIFDEYIDLLDNYKSIENSIYNLKQRDKHNTFMVYDTLVRNGKDKYRKKYFYNNNLLSAMDLDDYFVTTGDIKIDNILHIDKIGRKIVDALNHDIPYYVIDNSQFRSEQVKFLEEMLNNNKKLMYT